MATEGRSLHDAEGLRWRVASGRIEGQRGRSPRRSTGTANVSHGDEQHTRSRTLRACSSDGERQRGTSGAEADNPLYADRYFPSSREDNFRKLRHIKNAGDQRGPALVLRAPGLLWKAARDHGKAPVGRRWRARCCRLPSDRVFPKRERVCASRSRNCKEAPHLGAGRPSRRAHRAFVPAGRGPGGPRKYCLATEYKKLCSNSIGARQGGEWCRSSDGGRDGGTSERVGWLWRVR